MHAHDHPAAGYQTGHVGLNVTNLERSKAFYAAAFGFQIAGESKEEGRKYAFLGDGRRLVLTLWEQSEGAFSKTTPGLHHLSFQVPSAEDVAAAERRLRAMGARLLYDGLVPHGEGASSGGVFFEDPDGVRLEIFAPSGLESHAAPTPGAPSCGFF